MNPSRHSPVPPRRHRGRRLTGVAVLLVGTLTAAAPSPRETPLNPTDHDYLYRQHVWFQAQDAEAQHRYRKMHAAFESLPADDQTRLTRVLQDYQSWLARLPDADRQRVYDAPTRADRLAAIGELKEQEWVGTLPRPYQREYATTAGAERRAKVAAWRTEEVDRREEWNVAHRNWSDFLPGKQPAVLQGENLILVDRFVENLKPALSNDERQRLDLSKAMITDQGAYYPYAWTVANLADAHPLCPGRMGPKDFATLPPTVSTHLAKQTHLFKKKGGTLIASADDARDVRRAIGRWPDFAIELTKYIHKHGLKELPALGDCREVDMPPEVQDALKQLRTLSRKFSEVKTQLDQLDKTQGNWPEYPLKLLEVCRKNQVPVPGWALPGQPQVWDKLKAGRGKVK